MRRTVAALVLIVFSCILIAPSSSSSETEDPRDMARVPELSGFSPLELSPGAGGVMEFTFINRYDARLTNITVSLEIYRYATVTTTEAVSDSSLGAPRICPEQRPSDCARSARSGHPALEGRADSTGSRVRFAFDVLTSMATPHGGMFDPATYLVRVELRFSYQEVGPNGTKGLPFRMISRGHIDDAAWDAARLGGGLDIVVIENAHQESGRPIVGVATETSFIVRETVPVWPIAVLTILLVVCVAVGIHLYFKDKKREGVDGSDKALQKRTRETRQRRRVSK